MKLGVTFPQTEIGTDPGAIREFAQAVEGLGFNHLLVYDHVLGADTSHYKDWSGTYTKEDMFHEPFVLYGYLAAVTSSIELTTGIIILPQRQTALVAKQAAEVDVLSGGRLRLGIGIGWNHVEFEALGQDFHVRGKRSEEQIELMRQLWTNEAVTFNGKWDKITAAGLNPLPVQRPIPIWLGGSSEQVLKRVATLSDGWIPDGNAKRGYATTPGAHPSLRRRGGPRSGSYRDRGGRASCGRWARRLGEDPGSMARAGCNPYLAEHNERRLEDSRRALGRGAPLP